jgi:hypothetical protein
MWRDWLHIGYYDNLFFPWQGKEISYRDLQFTLVKDKLETMVQVTGTGLHSTKTRVSWSMTQTHKKWCTCVQRWYFWDCHAKVQFHKFWSWNFPCKHHHHHHHHHNISVTELGHLLTRSGLTYPEVSSKVYHDSFCQLGNSVSLHRGMYYKAFYLHVVSSFSCIPVICPILVLFLIPLQFVSYANLGPKTDM